MSRKRLISLIVMAFIIIIFALVYLELAVGVFGTPWAGS